MTSRNLEAYAGRNKTIYSGKEYRDAGPRKGIFTSYLSAMHQWKDIRRNSANDNEG
jgi:hypothetical protein